MKSNSIYASEVNWKVVENAFQEGHLIVFPLGAGCKEHGLHLPNNTDQIQAEYFTAMMAENFPIVVMPTITFSRFPAFVDYAGSTSLSTDNCTEQYVTFCEQLHQQGAKAFYFINFGISTNPPLKAAQNTLADKNIPMNYTDLTTLDFSDIAKQKGGTHADEIETSVMLFIKPSVVDMSKAKPDFDDKPGKLTPTPPPSNSNYAYSPTGAWGDPTLATEEKGKIVTDRYTRLISEDIKTLLQQIAVEHEVVTTSRLGP